MGLSSPALYTKFVPSKYAKFWLSGDIARISNSIFLPSTINCFISPSLYFIILLSKSAKPFESMTLLLDVDTRYGLTLNSLESGSKVDGIESIWYSAPFAVCIESIKNDVNPLKGRSF